RRPGMSKTRLGQLLGDHAIAYEHRKPLGTPPDIRWLFKNGRVSEGAAAFRTHLERAAAPELDALAAELEHAAAEASDPLWRLPLWAGYEEALDSDIADLKNDPDAWAQAGSVTAALFLKRFAPQAGAWVHLDIFAWNPKARPGFSAGAEAQAIRALLRVVRNRFS
ncbi:MAG TPA: DUF488 family protein, partial [Caulobacteraceae bacterium]